MGGEDKYIEKVKDDRFLSERLAMMIPGFRGYKEKELRRETDQLVRSKVYVTLKSGLKDLTWCYREIVNGDYNRSNQVNRLLMKTDRIAEKINHADRGYSGIWQATKVKEGELLELIRYDYSLIQHAEDIKKSIAAIKDEIKKKQFDAALTLVDSCEESVNDFDNKFSEREDVILGLVKGGEEHA